MDSEGLLRAFGKLLKRLGIEAWEVLIKALSCQMETRALTGNWVQVAHQWFGNLVTCLDWDQLTVNEGMASFMEYFCLQNVLPEAIAGALMRRAASPMSEPL